MKRHSLDDESTHPGSLIAGSRLPPKRGLTWPGSTLVPSYSVESDYAPGPGQAALRGQARTRDEAARVRALVVQGVALHLMMSSWDSICLTVRVAASARNLGRGARRGRVGQRGRLRRFKGQIPTPKLCRA